MMMLSTMVMVQAQTKARNSQTLATMHHLLRIALANIALLRPHRMRTQQSYVASGHTIVVHVLQTWTIYSSTWTTIVWPDAHSFPSVGSAANSPPAPMR